MLKGKVAVITGGSRGIGKAIALNLASKGASIAVIYAGNDVKAQKVCQECTDKYGVKALPYVCDVSDFTATKEIVSQVKKDFGSIHILVNNAGITKDGLMPMMKEEDFDRVLDVNLKGAFHMMRHCTPLFLRNKEGCIINISSICGVIGNPGQCNYSASKAGLIGLTKSAAKELASKGIRCNAVAPGFIKTDMTAELENNPLLEAIPLGRMGEPEEIAEAVAFLAMANYITGQVLCVDGGIAM